MSNMILKKDDGYVKAFKPNSELMKLLSSKYAIHLCGLSCDNCYATKCSKVHDRYKKTIDKYDFVTDGIQLVDEDGFVDRFVVSKCKNYVKSDQKKYSESELEHVIKAREELKKMYFDADTIEEADRLQYEIVNRNIVRKRKQNIKEGKPIDEGIDSCYPGGKFLTNDDYMKLKRRRLRSW